MPPPCRDDSWLTLALEWKAWQLRASPDAATLNMRVAFLNHCGEMIRLHGGFGMITRIELENFMSHRRSVIEPAKGLTVLVGPNNCGKSAVVSALQIVCENSPGDYMVRHDERECRIVVHTDDGHIIEWKRRGAVVNYVIDGQEIHRLRGDIPDGLHSILRLPKVLAADNREPYDVHFALQKSPIFLLGEPGSRAATFFASSSDAGKLIQMQARHREKFREASQEEKRLGQAAEQLEHKLTELAPVEDLQDRVEQAVADHSEIQELLARAGAMEDLRQTLSMRLNSFRRLEQEVRALGLLGQPPALTNVAPLDELIAKICEADRSASREGELAYTLSLLTGPPQPADTSVLQILTVQLGLTIQCCELGEARCGSLVELATPPTMANVGNLTMFCAQIDSFGQSISQLAAEASSFRALVAPPKQCDAEKLGEIVNHLEKATFLVVAISARASALKAVPKPPVMKDEAVLINTIQELARAQESIEFSQAAQHVFRTLPLVPEQTSLEPLAAYIREIECGNIDLARCERELQASHTKLARAERDLRQWAKQERRCPICGGKVDADVLVRAVGAGVRGHFHG